MLRKYVNGHTHTHIAELCSPLLLPLKCLGAKFKAKCTSSFVEQLFPLTNLGRKVGLMLMQKGYSPMSISKKVNLFKFVKILFEKLNEIGQS